MKRVLALLISAALMIGFIPSKAFAVDYDKDNDREPSYISLSGDDNYKIKYFYDDDYFRNSSYEYNASLSTMSIVMAMASTSFTGPEVDYVGGAQIIEQLMSDIGMENIEHNEWYDKKPEADSIAVACGSKKIDDFTLITIAVRGGGYGNEWSSNFTMGPSSNHEGFEKAAIDALDFTADYIEANGITGNIKVWTMGFSRAAATANIIGAKLDQYYSIGDDVILEPDGVFAYCFETPCGTTKEAIDFEYYYEDSIRKSVYDNIFNITNPNDLVTYVAPTADGFGFRRYGIDVYLPSAESSANYFELRQRMLNVYFSMPGGHNYSLDNFSLKKLSFDLGSLENTDTSSMSGDSFISETTSAVSQREFFKTFLDDLANDYVGNRDIYNASFQIELRTLFSLMLGSEPDEAATFMASLQQNLGDQLGGIILNYLYEQSGLSNIIGGGNNAKDPIGDVMVQAASDAGITDYDEETLRKTGNMLLNLIINQLFNNPNNFASLIGNVANVEEAHSSILCYSWLASMDSNYFYGVLPHTNNGDYRVLKISGNGNITVRNSNDKLVAQFIEGSPVYFNDSAYRYGNDGAQMLIYLPVNESYSVSLDYQDNTDISVVIAEYSAFACKYTRIINYQGDIESVSLPAFSDYEIQNSVPDGSSVKYKYTGNGSISANDYSGSYVDRGWRNVTVKSSSIVSGMAYGGGHYMVGETIFVEADANRGSSFSSWLENGSSSSTSSIALYRVNSDVELEADFKMALGKCSHTTPTLKNYKNPTCEDEGYTGDYYCSACGELLSQGKAIPAVEHFYKDDFCTKCQRVNLITYKAATEFKLFDDEQAAYDAYLEEKARLEAEENEIEVIPEIGGEGDSYDDDESDAIEMVEEGAKKDKSKKKDNTLAIIWTVSGVLAVGMGVTALIVGAKKKKQSK